MSQTHPPEEIYGKTRIANLEQTERFVGHFYGKIINAEIVNKPSRNHVEERAVFIIQIDLRKSSIIYEHSVHAHSPVEPGTELYNLGKSVGALNDKQNLDSLDDFVDQQIEFDITHYDGEFWIKPLSIKSSFKSWAEIDGYGGGGDA